MMKFVSFCILFLVTVSVNGQDLAVLLKEAENFERQLKEVEALDKYKQVLSVAPTNVKALVRAAELHAAIGGRQTDKNTKRLYFETAYALAKKVYDGNTTNADANYVLGMASGKMTEIETDNKKMVAFVKDIKIYAGNALTLQPTHAKANYSLGKWHYEMVNLSGIKKVAVKLFYGGLPNGDLDSSIAYFEKCRTLDPFFMLNYLDLAKAYKDNHRPSQAIEVLTKMVKLPLRTGDDAALKSEGAKMLNDIQ
jgi:tetratricopeptide (TPR) repeat protein